jgi:hypothetical protein
LTVVLLSQLVSGHAWADGLAIERGQGSGVYINRLAYQFPLAKQWPISDDWQASTYLEPVIGVWRGRSKVGDAPRIAELGLTPVMRFKQKNPNWFDPYLEVGLGLHFISGHHVTDNRDLGSNYLFGTHIGAGVRLGPQQQFEIAFRLQHLSNAGLKQPNEGIDFHIVHLGYNF